MTRSCELEVVFIILKKVEPGTTGCSSLFSLSHPVLVAGCDLHRSLRFVWTLGSLHGAHRICRAHPIATRLSLQTHCGSQRKRAIEPKKKVKRRIKNKGKKKGKKGDGKKKGKGKAKAGAKSKKKKKK